MSTKTVSGLVIAVLRHGTTTNGNPILRVVLSTPTTGYPGNATFEVKRNSGLSLAINNPEYRDIPHLFALTNAGYLACDMGEL